MNTCTCAIISKHYCQHRANHTSIATGCDLFFIQVIAACQLLGSRSTLPFIFMAGRIPCLSLAVEIVANDVRKLWLWIPDRFIPRSCTDAESLEDHHRHGRHDPSRWMRESRTDAWTDHKTMKLSIRKLYWGSDWMFVLLISAHLQHFIGPVAQYRKWTHFPSSHDRSMDVWENEW